MERVIENDNLLEEILLRLPAEKVHGFLPVSKRWYNLLSSSSFRRRHQSSSSKILMIDQWRGAVTSLLEVCNGVTILETSHIHPDKLLPSIQPFYQKFCQKIDEYKEIDFKILDVHNGLFLLSLARKQSLREVYYLVSNPLTKEYHELPRSTKQKSPHIIYRQVAFAPSSKPYNHYKVIHVSVHNGTHRDYIVEVYSSETGIWKELRHIDIRHIDLYKSRYVVWDNCLILVPKYRWTGGVCVLDLEGLCVSHSSILLSTLIEICDWIDYLGESGGILYAIVYMDNADSENNHYKLWEMKEFDGSWKEKFQFKTKKDVSPLYVHRDGDHVWLSLLLPSGKVYYCLDGNTERTEEACEEVKHDYIFNIRTYTPTLFPLGG